MILPILVRIVHILIIIFMVVAPFLDDPLLLFLHVAGGLTLLLHWYLNNDACCLTILESYLRGVDVDKSISGQFIRPLYNIPQGEWNNIIKILTIILILISCAKLIVLVNPDIFLNLRL
jgi:uncharacterized protein YhhL (DUF1145 family)